MLSKIEITIGHKIYGIIAVCVIGLMGVLAFDIYQLNLGLERQKEIELTHLVDVALSIARQEHAAAQAGTLTPAVARERAAARIGELRYGDNDYYTIVDQLQRMVMHPISPKLNGSDVANIKDPNGKTFALEFIDVVKRAGGGFVAYDWPKAGSDKPQPKLSYAGGFAPWGWVITAGVYVDDLAALGWAAAKRAMLMAGFVLLVVISISVVVARRTSGAIIGLTASMRTLAAGDLNAAPPGLARRDEIGTMARATDGFRQNLRRMKDMEATQKEAEARAESERRASDERDAARQKLAEETAAAQRRQAMHELADRFEGAVGGVIDTVSTASMDLESTAATLTKAADNTQDLSGAVAAASEQASANVRTVAAATDEMSSSVDEISRQVQESSRIAHEAVRQAQTTDARIGELAEAASRIGDVVKLITAIAEQTNLLALNATIEAARAGEAGRGFAVVASEVKALAGQTAKATGEIAAQIAGMQQATAQSVDAIKQIGATIGQISDISASIASAVEQQGAATGEIARNVQQAAKGTTEVATKITDVNRGAAETGEASGSLLVSAQALARQSGVLKHEVETFLATVRAA